MNVGESDELPGLDGPRPRRVVVVQNHGDCQVPSHRAQPDVRHRFAVRIVVLLVFHGELRTVPHRQDGVVLGGEEGRGDHLAREIEVVSIDHVAEPTGTHRWVEIQLVLRPLAERLDAQVIGVGHSTRIRPGPGNDLRIRLAVEADGAGEVSPHRLEFVLKRLYREAMDADDVTNGSDVGQPLLASVEDDTLQPNGWRTFVHDRDNRAEIGSF